MDSSERPSCAVVTVTVLGILTAGRVAGDTLHPIPEADLRVGGPIGERIEAFEEAGDYVGTGLDGVPFHRTPRPRWESLHCLQGLADLDRITGEPDYRRAFLHHWASIRRFVQRNIGGFSARARRRRSVCRDPPRDVQHRRLCGRRPPAAQPSGTGVQCMGGGQ